MLDRPYSDEMLQRIARENNLSETAIRRRILSAARVTPHVPYWAGVLGRSDIVAYQASARSGVLYTHLAGERVQLGGKAALFSVGEIFLPPDAK